MPDLSMSVPSLTTEQMREVDRIMVDELGIELMQMMENAGRHLAHLARVRFLGGDPTGSEVVVLAGRGGNGGGALVCARRLQGWGASMRVFLSRPIEDFSGVPAHQLEILQRLGVPLRSGMATGIEEAPVLIVDGLIGYSLSGAPRGLAAELIRWANARGEPVLALDVPSGLESTTGTATEPTIRAAATLTLALPKQGLYAPTAEPFVGELYLADIGVPPSVYAAPTLGLAVGPLFAREEILRLR